MAFGPIWKAVKAINKVRRRIYITFFGPVPDYSSFDKLV